MWKLLLVMAPAYRKVGAPHDTAVPGVSDSNVTLRAHAVPGVIGPNTPSASVTVSITPAACQVMGLAETSRAANALTASATAKTPRRATIEPTSLG